MRNRVKIGYSVTISVVVLTLTAVALGQFQGGPPRGGAAIRLWVGVAEGARAVVEALVEVETKTPGGSERLLDDLPLNSMQQGLDAQAALVAYDQTVRQQTLLARGVLLDKLKTVLTDDQFIQIKVELEQIPLLSPPPQQQRGLRAIDLVDHLMSFDKDHNGRITKDELPERMLNILEQGDTNHDGALDREEIMNYALRAGVNNQPPGRGGRGGRGGPPPGRGPGPGGFPPSPPPDQQ